MEICWKFVISSHFSLPSGCVDRSLHSKLGDRSEEGLCFTMSKVAETLMSGLCRVFRGSGYENRSSDGNTMFQKNYSTNGLTLKPSPGFHFHFRQFV